MKTFILSIAFLTLCIIGNAQTENQYDIAELSKQLNLSQEQIAKIKEINSGIGKRFADIGQDNSLSGREKGQRKQELALKHKQEIMDVLTPEQQDIWKNNYDKQNMGVKNSLTDTFDDRLDALEKKYEREKKAIEKDNRLSKTERKMKEDALKTQYKADKERLKNEKDNIKNSVLLSE